MSDAVVEDDVSERYVRSETDGLSGPMEDLRVEIMMTKVWMMASVLGVMARATHWF